MKTLMILDGNSIINRAYYGIKMLNAPDGTPTNGVYGFLTILQRLMAEYNPDAVCAAFDVHAPTFRHKACSTYKAQRKPMDDELKVQMPIMKNILKLMNIPVFELEGYEADDIIGTAAGICEEKGWRCIAVTGDKDSLQLVTDNVSVCHIKTRMGKTETTLYTPEVFKAEYGFEPKGIIDLKALMGDPSDNIPGVRGIGEKGAMDLIGRFGSIESIYSALDGLDIKESIRKKLAEGEESARQSYWLATIFNLVPVDFDPEKCLVSTDYSGELYDEFRRLGFFKFIEKMGLKSASQTPAEQTTEKKEMPVVEVGDDISFTDILTQREYVAVATDRDQSYIDICDGENIYRANRLTCMLSYDALLEKLFSAEVKKAGHNVKDLMRTLLENSLGIEGFVFDTALAAYLVSSTDSDYELSRLSELYLGHDGCEAQKIYELVPVLEKKLKELGMTELYEAAELPLCSVLAKMEHTGFLVDRKALAEFGDGLTETIDALQKTVWQEAGHEFNINSPKQLGEVLFEELQLPYGKKTKTGWSTGAEVLEKLRNVYPIADAILEYRELTKLKSTYADGLLKVISPDGRIHTNFKMTVTATGRLSSTEPNLQNIPVRRQLGSQIRKMFIPGEGNILVDADYSQIELRLLAAITGDENMINAFLSGEDFHAATAAMMFGIPVEEVTPQVRSRAKAVNFGIIYGMQAFTLAQDLHVSRKEAQEYMDAYFARFPKVAEYMKSIVEQAERDGYVSTLYGRRRALPELKSSSYMTREFGKRVALNMPIQGTAADIIKLAMAAADRAIEESGLKARLILQVHDELIIECPEDEAGKAAELLKNAMENAAHMAVPLLVETGVGKSWAEAH